MRLGPDFPTQTLTHAAPLLQSRSMGRALPLAITFLSSVSFALAGCQPSAAAAVLSGPYQGTELKKPAPDFDLPDHRGARITLSDLRGQVVALTFMDSQCQEVCPLTAVHLRSAYRQLGSEASSVVFVGINVNLEANTIEDVLTTTQNWQLDEIASWHFLTGSEDQLRPIWETYDVTVYPAPEGEGELVHTPGVFLIDQAGQLRWYVSTPFDDLGTPAWTQPLSELLVKHIGELLRGR